MTSRRAAIQVPRAIRADELQRLIHRLQFLVRHDPWWQGYAFHVFAGDRLALALPEEDIGTDHASELLIELQEIVTAPCAATLH